MTPPPSEPSPPLEPSQRLVPAELRGIQLGDFLERLWPQGDRRFLRAAIRDGQVLVNRAPRRPQARLRPGDLVEVAFDPDEIPQHPEELPAEERGQLPVLHEDDRILVVDKPSGMHTVPDRGGKYRGVHGVLSELRPGADLRIVHRLDQGTSGCLVLAKGLDVARQLSEAFAEGRVHKEYLALVCGVPSRPRFEVRKPLGPDRRRPGRIRAVAAGSKGAREAHTEVELQEAFKAHALLRVKPRTGRSHQIRVHLAASGHPVVGDPDYGSGQPLLLSRIKPGFKIRRGVAERPLLERMFLHAEVIELPGAVDGESVRVSAPLPAELEMVLGKLRRFAAPGRMTCD